mgnify:CR=1 FL=1
MKIRLYNHHYLPDDGSWVYIFMDQMKQLEDFGLMDAMEFLEFTALGNDEQIKLFKDICKLYPKVIVDVIHNDVTGEELKDGVVVYPFTLSCVFPYAEMPRIAPIDK